MVQDIKVIIGRWGMVTFAYLLLAILFCWQIGMPMTTSSIWYSLVYALVLTSCSMLPKHRKGQAVILWLGMSLVVILYFVQAVYFNAFGQLGQVYRLTDVGELVGVSSSIPAFLSWKQFALFLPLVILGGYQHITSKSEVSSRLAALVSLVVALLLLLGSNVYMVRFLGQQNKQTLQNVVDYTRNYGLIDLTIHDTIHYFFPKYGKQELVSQGLEELAHEFVLSQEVNEMTNRYQGKNLVFITAESLAPYAIDEELTPTLYRLREEGYAFTQYYNPILNTFAAEYALLKGFAYMADRPNFPITAEASMPTLFKEQGYRATAFHNYSDTFYRRSEHHVSLGFDSFYGSESLDIALPQEHDFPRDEDLFAKSYPLYYENEPFFAYHLTVSGHSPYRFDQRLSSHENYERVRARYPDDSEELAVYKAVTMHTDKGVEMLINQLEEGGVLEDTVIVIVGDHYPYGLSYSDITTGAALSNSLELYKVPLIIWDASKPSQTVDTVMGSYDVLPTLANLFGLSLDYAVGKDAFSTAKDDIVVEWYNSRDFSVLTGTGGYDAADSVQIGTWSEQQVQAYRERSYMRHMLNDEAVIRAYFRKQENS